MTELHEKILAYAFDAYSTEPEKPWAKYPKYEVLRRNDNGKWYGIIMEIPKSRLGLEEDGNIEILNVKSDAFLIGNLLERDGFYPAYHMNKLYWITVSLEGELTEEEIKGLLDLSYELTYTKSGKKQWKD